MIFRKKRMKADLEEMKAGLRASGIDPANTDFSRALMYKEMERRGKKRKDKRKNDQ